VPLEQIALVVAPATADDVPGRPLAETFPFRWTSSGWTRHTYRWRLAGLDRWAEELGTGIYLGNGRGSTEEIPLNRRIQGGRFAPIRPDSPRFAPRLWDGCGMLLAALVAGCVVDGDTGTLPTPPIDTAWIGGGAGNVSAEVLEAGPLPCEQDLELDPPELTLGAAGAAAATVHGCAQGVAAQCDVAIEALVEPELREGDVVGVRLNSAAADTGEGGLRVRW